jgi:predicted ATP-dependent serine protease
MNTNIVLFENIEIPESFSKTHKTGIELLDGFLSLNGGIVPSMSYMFTGESGAGKTTISNYIMGGVATQESPAVFMSFEMSKEQAKYQFEGKVNFSNVYIVDELKEESTEGLIALLNSISEFNPSVLVVDSLQMLSSLIYGDPTSTKGQSDIAKIIMQFSKETGCPSIIIGQCNKEGEYLGPTFVKHILDAHLHASIEKKTGSRNIMFEKNRFGKVGDKLHYKFKNDGSVVFLVEAQTNTPMLEKEFEWSEATQIIKSIFGEVIASEIKEMLNAGITSPQLTFEGSTEVEFCNPEFHFKSNVRVHEPNAPYCINNTIYVDIEFSKFMFTENNLEELKQREPLLAQFPQFKTAKQIFLFEIMVFIAEAITLAKPNSRKFMKALNSIVSRYA